MDINTGRPEIRSGDFDVSVNGSGLRKGDDPFAEIRLSADGRTAIVLDDAADCRRLIAAARRAEQMLEAAVVPHSFRADTKVSYRCRDCGVHASHHINPPAVVAGEVVAEAPELERTGWGTRLAVCGRHAAMDANGRCDHCEEVAPRAALRIGGNLVPLGGQS